MEGKPACGSDDPTESSRSLSLSNPTKHLGSRDVPTLGAAASAARSYVPTTSGCRARITPDDTWPDEAPTLPSGNVLHGRKSEVSHITITEPGSSPADAFDESQRNSWPDMVYAEDAIRWHYIGIGDDTARDSMTPSRRRNVRRQAEIDIAFDRDTQLYTGLSQDISEGGVFIATYQVQPIGTPIRLSFELPDGTKISARGEVRWLRETSNASRPGIGVAFTEMTSEALAALGHFCRRFAPLYIEV